MRVFARVLNGLGDYLRADDALCRSRKKQAYRARAAVHVQNRFALGRSVLDGLFIELFGLGRVYLIKGLRSELIDYTA